MTVLYKSTYLLTYSIMERINRELTADHADVIGSVADSERDGVLLSLDDVNNKCFL